MAASATTFGVSRIIPTEITDIAYLSGILILPKQEYNGQADYWWLRSPSTRYIDSYYAYLVRSGDVDYFSVDLSYGKLSVLSYD